METIANKILFTFDILFDTDIGIFNLIKNEYRNEDLVNLNIVDNIPLSDLKRLSIERFDPNPLSAIMNKDVVTEENMNELYMQFIMERYPDIVKYSIPTDVLKLVNRLAMADNNISSVFIACRESEEVNQIRRYLPNIPSEKYTFVPYHTLYSEIDLRDYDTVFIKSYYDVLRLTHIEGKNIVVANCNSNKIKVGNSIELDPEVSIKIVDKVVVSTIDLYSSSSISS